MFLLLFDYFIWILPFFYLLRNVSIHKSSRFVLQFEKLLHPDCIGLLGDRKKSLVSVAQPVLLCLGIPPLFKDSDIFVSEVRHPHSFGLVIQLTMDA
jgi:hypothetical protein